MISISIITMIIISPHHQDCNHRHCHSFADMIFVTSSTSGASVKYFWI